MVVCILRMRRRIRHQSSLSVCCCSCRFSSDSMGLITGVCAFLYHLPQIYKWLLKPYYIISFLMTVAFLLVRKAPGLCEHLSSQREDGNSCDFDWVRVEYCC